MSDQNIVVEYMDNHHYDIRETHNGRWIDQKCTYDVLCFSADCIIEYLGDEHERAFTSPDLWRSEYAGRQVRDVFSKPDTSDKKALDEFNKFFRQPLKLFAAAGVLREVSRNRRGIHFLVHDYAMLEYVSAREYQALEFLTAYITKVLSDSGLSKDFDRFFELQTVDSLLDLRHKFYLFCLKNTPINTEVESNRIFTKVLNPLAFHRHLHGTERGTLSRQVITRDKLAYNQPNWRDVLSGKDKTVPRRGYTPPVGIDTSLESKVSEAKRIVKQFNDTWRGGASEVIDDFAAAHKANAAHHIFPQWAHRELATYPENITALTTAQHLGRAHPNGNTHEIDPDYQRLCLIAKLRIVRDNVEGKLGDKVIYSYDKFIHVLDTGLETNGYFSRLPKNDWDVIESHIDLFF